MKFNFDCEQALDCDENGFAVLEGSYQNKIIPGYRLYVKEILDRMGELSSKSQNLQTTITNTSRFFPSDQRLYIKANKNIVYGYIKVGLKKLFIRDRFFNYHERKTLSLLDFYIYDSAQRQGIGKNLFDFMLKVENIRADQLAYDRPTLRLLAFLKKNYGLDNYITQNNSFIIFDNFFEPNSIFYNDTEFDNDTNRVIQCLSTPNYLNMSSNYSKNRNYIYNNQYNPLSRSSPKISTNSNRNGNNYNMNSNNRENDQPRTMSPIGKQLVYSNDFSNNVVNKDVYKNPNTGFQKYYMDKDDTLAYDNIYSKQKMNLINDYMSARKQTPHEYIKEQNNRNENSINSSNQRVNELNDKISGIKYNNRYQEDQLYNKRYDYATLFDDKKIAENEYMQQNENLQRSQDYRNRRDYQDYQNNQRINMRKSPKVLQSYTPGNNYVIDKQNSSKFEANNYNNGPNDQYYENRTKQDMDYNNNYNYQEQNQNRRYY